MKILLLILCLSGTCLAAETTGHIAKYGVGVNIPPGWDTTDLGPNFHGIEINRTDSLVIYIVEQKPGASQNILENMSKDVPGQITGPSPEKGGTSWPQYPTQAG